MNKISITILFLMLSISFSQDIDLELLLEAESESQEQVELLEILYDLKEHPLDLNTASLEDLQTIPWITNRIARAIIKYRQSRNGFRTVNELLKLKEMDEKTYSIVQIFFTIGWQKSIALNLRQRVYRQNELPQGFQKNIYIGGPEKYYTRLKGQVGNGLFFGFITEKDPGESRFNDHFLANVKAVVPQIKSTVHFGNYIYEAGQGLVFWGPYRFTKGVAPVHAFKQTPRGLVSFTSASEFGAMNGAAITTAINPIRLTVLYSDSKIDASAENDSISSIVTSGLHRTDAELNKENNLSEKIFGFAGAVESDVGRIELLFQSTHYNKPFIEKSGFESESNFSGTSNFISGINFNYYFNNINLSGEFARSQNGAYSFITNGIINFDRFDLVLSARRFSPEFQNFRSLAFGNTDGSRNEDGLYLGVNIKVLPQLSFSFYFDSYQHPWPKYLYPFPSEGRDQMFYFYYKPHSKFQLQTRLKIKTVDKQSLVLDRFESIDKLLSGNKYNARIQLDYITNNGNSFRSRIEYNFVDWNKRNLNFQALQDTAGFLLYNQISTNIGERINVKSRLCFFNAPSYDVRFYVFENDVPGIMKLKMLQHNGKRFFLLFQYKVSKMFDLYAKFEQTYYENRDTIGSGYNLIFDNTENAVSLQLEWRY